MVAVGVVALVIVVRVLRIGAVEQDCARVVDILVLGVVFMMQVVEGVEMEVGYCVRLVLWCANGRGYFLCHFSLKLVEMNRLTVDGFLFAMEIWVDCFVLLEHGSLGKKVGADVLMDVLVEVVVVEGLDVVQAGFFVTSRRGFLVDIMGVRLLMEVVVGVVVLVGAFVLV